MNTSRTRTDTPTKSNRKIPPRQIFSDPGCLLGFGLGTGLVPIAPGTFGTLLGVPLYLLMTELSLAVYLTVVALLFGVGIVICQHCEDRLAIRDHSGIVWDEIVGFLITMAAVPPSWSGILLGFLLFRLFDILKPWPIRRLDRQLHGGFGVMLDDVVAGLFASILLQLILQSGVL